MSMCLEAIVPKAGATMSPDHYVFGFLSKRHCEISYLYRTANSKSLPLMMCTEIQMNCHFTKRGVNMLGNLRAWRGLHWY